MRISVSMPRQGDLASLRMMTSSEFAAKFAMGHALIQSIISSCSSSNLLLRPAAYLLGLVRPYVSIWDLRGYATPPGLPVLIPELGVLTFEAVDLAAVITAVNAALGSAAAAVHIEP